MSLIMLILSVVIIAAIVITLIVARLQRRAIAELALGLGVALAGWSVIYGVALVGTSLASDVKVLGTNQDKHFCGFYLDCHLHVAVVRVDTSRLLGPASARVRARGRFVAVTLRVSSDAGRMPIRFVGPRARVLDAFGREFPRDEAAERALAWAGAPSVPLTQTVEAGEAFLTTVVFDVPSDSADLVLDVTDGYAVDRIIELFLIGDDDSVLHRRTVFRLTP